VKCIKTNRRYILSLLPVLLVITGCGVSISRQLQPDRLRYPGRDMITAAVMLDGAEVAFDVEPAEHAARVIGDTLYSFIDGEYNRILMTDIELVVVERFFPVPNPAALESGGVTLIDAIWKVFKWSAPVTIPAAFLLALWNEHK